MGTNFTLVAFALLLMTAIAQALADRKDVLNLELGLERSSDVVRLELADFYKTGSDANNTDPANNTTGVLVSSTCSNVLLFGTSLYMGAAFVTAMLPVLLEVLGFAGN